MLHLGNFIYFCTLKGVHNGLNREPGESPGQARCCKSPNIGIIQSLNGARARPREDGSDAVLTRETSQKTCRQQFRYARRSWNSAANNDIKG